MRGNAVLRATVAAATVMALSIGGLAAHVSSQRAFASEIRTKAANSFKSTGSFRAEIVERELIGPDRYRSVRQRVLVVGADAYRVDLVETDEQGREIESTTLVADGTITSMVQEPGGPARLHVVENAPPGLGAVLDNALGQHVRSLLEAPGIRSAGKESVRGRPALKLRLGPDHEMWIDEQTSLPIRERFTSGDTVTHEIEFVSFESDPRIAGDELSARSLGGRTAFVEDLGFRRTTRDAAPADLLGFTPEKVRAPQGWTLGTSGYIDPSVSAEGAPGRPAWVERYDGSNGTVIVTQMKAPPGVDPADPASLSGEGAPTVTFVNDIPVAYYRDHWKTHMVCSAGGVLITLEGTVPIEELIEFAGSVL